jgi:hypothetical protein
MNDSIDSLTNNLRYYDNGTNYYILIEIVIIISIIFIINRIKKNKIVPKIISKLDANKKTYNNLVQPPKNDNKKDVNLINEPQNQINPSKEQIEKERKIELEKIKREQTERAIKLEDELAAREKLEYDRKLEQKRVVKEKAEQERKNKEQESIAKEKQEGINTEQKQSYKIIIPKNPKTTFVQAKEEEQNKIKFIGYEPSIKFEQLEPYNYPMVFMPKPRSVIKFPRKGKQGLKGYTEDLFKQNILDHFKNVFQIFDDRFVLYKSNQNPFEPDFALVDEKNDLNLFIDIEIDEPYDGISRQPIHYVDFDKQRNSFFKNRGWIVIRFAEYQIFKETISCCKFISDVVKSVNPNFIISDKLLKVNNVVLIQQWTKEQATNWAFEKYREEYLGIDKFIKQEHEIILGNLNETEIGKEIEKLVDEEQVDNLEFRKNLILRAIRYNNFISCRISSNYTVLKPIRIKNTYLVCFCYLKNSEVSYEINQINDIVLRDKPFVFRINGQVGPTEIKTFILKYIGSKNPIRIKYTKSAFRLLTVDEETGEIILSDVDRDSLRTITGFDLLSKLISQEKINQYNMNDSDYIAGFCHLRNEIRNFRFDRINELEILNI